MLNDAAPHLNETQRLLRDSVAQFVARESDVSRARATRVEQGGFDQATWSTMADNGWLGLRFEEDHGGLGLGLAEAAVVLEELGRALVPEPVCAATVLAAGVLARSGNEPLKQAHLPSIAEGREIPALAWQEQPNCYDPAAIVTRAETSDGITRLTGEKRFVPAIGSASALLVSARGPAGVGVYWVERGAGGLDVRSERSVDGVDIGRVTLQETPATSVVAETGGETLIAPALDEARLLGAAELVGVMSQALETTLDYVKQREQFGQPIGKFQALQHRLVDLWVQTELARSSVIRGVQTFESTTDEGRRVEAASAAKARASDAAMLVTRQGIQLHGGIGYTDACDIGLFLKRALNLSSWLGNGAVHRRRIAALPMRGD